MDDGQKRCIACRYANSGVCTVCYDYDKFVEDDRGDE